MKNETTCLEVSNIGLYYALKNGFLRTKKFWALKDISFSLRTGEALGVVGRNGVGKSTLLQIIAGIMEPDKGSIQRNVNSISLMSLQIGFIPHLTGRENAVLSGLFQGMRRANIETSLDEIKKFSELDNFFEEPLSTYSSGMRARLGFSCALQIDPDLYLIDEVMAVGDESFRQKSMAALKDKLQQDKSLIFVSHAPMQVQKICDRTLWIEHGEVVQIGDTKTVLEAYKNASRK